MEGKEQKMTQTTSEMSLNPCDVLTILGVTKHPLVRKKPVARFYYKGHHTHPVRRTVLLTDVTEDLVRGYEIREGSEVRGLVQAPIKSFRRDRIALLSQLGARKHRDPGPAVSSLRRETMKRLVLTGV
jgi:hypothetical protein